MSESEKPNIVIILADDMGYSDIGAFGSEISTPNLDELAGRGVRFTQFYNSARCCPTRASLLTGVDPQVASVGHMVSDYELPGYRGFLGSDVVTIAEILRSEGYRTMLSGKWHVGGTYHPLHEAQWEIAGSPGHPTPRQRGFERFYGILTGGGSYYRPPTLMRDDHFIEPDSPDYHLTDAIGEAAAQMIDECENDSPYFLYLSYTAPHWPLHAREPDIARYESRYRNGWDAIRTARHERLKALGIVDSKWTISARDGGSHAWTDETNRDWEDLRMATYAAQIEQLDRSIGVVLDSIQRRRDSENTIVMFLSDNGGCAEFLNEDGDTDSWPGHYARPTIDGRPVHVGNTPLLRPGGDQTFMSYDLPWANASNSPFRLFKHWVHEGGISTPFIINWPRRLATGVCHAPYHVQDTMASCLDAAGAEYPDEYQGNPIVPMSGESFLPAAANASGSLGIWTRSQPIFWEHEGNCAARDGEWKLVRKYPGNWELYNMISDRTELNDLAAGDPNRVRRMVGEFTQWAADSRVLEWPIRR